MKQWIVIILVILAVLIVAALVMQALKRKKEHVARERASELRSEAAQTASSQREQEAAAREAEAEAERARAQADKLDARAEEQRVSYDMTRARQEDAVREADRLDPDVDHRSEDYHPDLDGTPTQRVQGQSTHRTAGEIHEQSTGAGASENGSGAHRATGQANPVPNGPETIVPDGYDQERGDRA